MPIKVPRFICALVLCALGSVTASAHTAATSTTPKTGAVLDQSPPSIEITFKEAARLTSVVVRQEGQPERKLSFTPSGAAKTFTIPSPTLASGRSEVHWTALSKDGHVVKGVIVLTLTPSATQSS